MDLINKAVLGYLRDKYNLFFAPKCCYFTGVAKMQKQF